MLGEFIGLFSVVMVFMIPIYAIYRGYNQSDEKIQIKKLKEQTKLEQIKQENYLLENESMRIELNRIKKENAKKEKKALENKENRRWLIEETKEAEKDKVE